MSKFEDEILIFELKILQPVKPSEVRTVQKTPANGTWPEGVVYGRV
jgi:hypothetical protein